VLTILANIVGVWISYRIMNLFTKDKVWRITATLKNKAQFDECVAQLEKFNIGCTPIDRTSSVDIYSYNQKESRIIKNILDNYEYKYFIQEMTKKF
jgi:hypothetical protein